MNDSVLSLESCKPGLGTVNKLWMESSSKAMSCQLVSPGSPFFLTNRWHLGSENFPEHFVSLYICPQNPSEFQRNVLGSLSQNVEIVWYKGWAISPPLFLVLENNLVSECALSCAGMQGPSGDEVALSENPWVWWCPEANFLYPHLPPVLDL